MKSARTGGGVRSRRRGGQHCRPGTRRLARRPAAAAAAPRLASLNNADPRCTTRYSCRIQILPTQQREQEGVMVGTMEMVKSAMITVASCAIAVLPAVFAELVSGEVDRLQAAVGDRLIEHEDPSLVSALKLAGDFLLERPFRLTLWRVFPLGAPLALAFAGLCTAYLTVLVQLTGAI
ncbi:uncharacterized protein LOC125228660 [Leguminivora glycinivorella]|uniref:uncharacterized protein LOC125228660 n=1 Tax=Leguminivora glycinivorella TaxID=1035111 RepID=UPI002010746F|nr:uncharacterized protein LOC125228660 [Leguminivora glycinivorella]